MTARASEVHTLSFAVLTFDENYRFATVQLEFVPKTQNHHTFIKIPTLGSTQRGFDEDRFIYPVRALKAYRARTVQLRIKNP